MNRILETGNRIWETGARIVEPFVPTMETAAFVAISIVGMQYAAKTLEADAIPPVTFGVVAALTQRTFAVFLKNINQDLKKDKKEQTFTKTVDYSLAALAAYALTGPLIKAGTEDLQHATLSEQDMGAAPPVNPAAFAIVGAGTFGAANSLFDYLSPTKTLSKIAEFPSKQLPIGKYLTSFVAALLVADQMGKQLSSYTLDESGQDLFKACTLAAAAGTMVGISLTDFLSPRTETEKNKLNFLNSATLKSKHIH